MPQVYTSTETYHAILVAGLPLFYEFEAGANIWPGMVVELDAPTEGQVIACTQGDNPVGVADLAMAYQDGRGSVRFGTCDSHSTDTTHYYQAGDQVKVISGPIVVMLILDAGENLIVGEKVQCAATAGYVEEYACLTTSDPCALVAEALENVTTGVGECQYFMAKLLI
jgi:hypothetical protein